MRILLTGASGNLGRQILPVLIQHGHTVLAVGRNSQLLDTLCEPFGACAEPMPCDLSINGNLPLPDDYEAVVHTAAHATAQEDTDAHVTHNIIGTRQLLRHAARRSGRPFIFFSSLSVCGTIHDSLVDEQTPICNPGSYGISKLIGEKLLIEYATQFRTVALRLPGILAPGARDPWLARVFRDAQAQRPISIYTPTTPFNNAVHVDDLAAFVCDLLTRVQPGFDVLTMGATEPCPLQEVITAMIAGLSPIPVLHIVPAPRAPFLISNKKATRRYGYRPVSVLETVRRFAACAQLDTRPTDAQSRIPSTLHDAPLRHRELANDLIVTQASRTI